MSTTQVVTQTGIEHKTEVIKDELNPTWNKEIEFDLNKQPLSPQENIAITIKDWEKIGFHKIVATATVPLANLVRSKSHKLDLDVDLFGDGGKTQLPAKVQISLKYEAPEGEKKQDEGGEEEEEGDEGEEEEEAGGEPGKKRKRGKRKRKKKLSQKAQDFQIRVQIIEARQLSGNNLHPVVRVTAYDEDRETKTKKSTNKPVYKESFFFKFHASPATLFDELISFEVFNSIKYHSDPLIGCFQSDIGSIYDMPDHAFIRKWLLLTNPGDTAADEEEGNNTKKSKGIRGGGAMVGSPAGYLKATVFILGPGDPSPSLSKLAGNNDADDIESNLLRPSGVTLQPALFSLKVFMAEDLPQMDSGLMKGVKKFFNLAKEDEKLVDPYVVFSFCGKKSQTLTKYKKDNPDFKQILRVPFRFPSMCEHLKIQIFDWDRVGDDDCIGTAFLPLSTISSQGDEGFLPTFGPCFITFYGSVREFSELPDQYEELNLGKGEGVAYRGRLLVELNTELTEEVGNPMEDMKAGEAIKIQPYLSRTKYKLFACFYEANMVSETDGPVEFEVSIGNYGNKMDESVAPANTPPANAVFDGNHYFYLPWTEDKPCVSVESYWEDITFRLESLNIINGIMNSLKANRKAVQQLLDRKAPTKDAVAALFSLLDQLITSCRTPLPKKKGRCFNKLDAKIRSDRLYELRTIVEDALKLKDEATDVTKALTDVDGYLSRLKDLAEEPQNSLPDVIIWMISGSNRLAYYRIPAYKVLFSPMEGASGKHCAKTMEVMLKYPSDDGKDHPEVPAVVRLELWLGLEDYQASWTARENREGDFCVFAETYENEVKVGAWTKRLLTRPDFSDASGDIPLDKKDFKAPHGWKFDGTWFINPELSLKFSGDSGHKTFLEDVFENQSRMMPGGTFGPASVPWTEVHGDQAKGKEELTCPPGWEWTSEWTVDYNRAVDKDGWEYSVDVSYGAYGPIQKAYHMVRRRRWVRNRELKNPKAVQQQKEMEIFEKEGWEYAPVFTAKFHVKERKMDFVRRRRWHCKMVPKEGEEHYLAIPPVCLLEVKDGDQKGCVRNIPRMFVTFKNPHKFQLWAYIYQARDLLSMDESGMNDAYARVVFGKHSTVTKTLSQQLCPTWNQTLIFENVEIFESLHNLEKYPPSVVVEIFDKDPVDKDDFLGRCVMQPVVRLNGHEEPEPRLQWHKVRKGDEVAGELLMVSELFLDEGAELPFKPAMVEDVYQVRSGVHPKLQPTAVEVLCWGVRNMKKFELTNVSSPSLEFDVGGAIVKTEVIKDTKKKPNFDHPVLSRLIVNLPIEEIYTPPINIRIRDNRTFGRRPIVGVHSIRSLGKFRCATPQPTDSVDATPPTAGDEAAARSITSHESHVVDVKDKEKKKGKGKEGSRKKDDDDLIDWWSKFYASIGDKEKSELYLKKSYETLQVYESELEKQPQFNNFEDFILTFPFRRGRAKSKEEQEDATVGEFKGTFRVYPLPLDGNIKSLPESVYRNLPSSDPVECIVRVYVLKAIELHPTDPSGKADSYLIVTLGKEKIDDQDNYIANTINPIYGKMFELHAKIPLAKDLKIQVMDNDKFGRDDLIGETVIDLEQRMLSRYRASCGLPKTYCKSGPNKWRDAEKPTKILETWCEMNNKRSPVYEEESVTVGGETYHLAGFEPEDMVKHKHLGKVRQRLALHVLNTKGLVPEHVETRPLYSGRQQREQGKLQMWVDIFPKHLKPKVPVPISPRLPVDYVLRVIIWNTTDVILEETSITGEKMSDIYVKGWIGGIDESQSTDVHYRSLSGEGNFNWRFVFPFSYLPHDKKLYITEKAHIWSLDETVQKISPRLVIQIWDNDILTDDFLGALELDLTKMPKPASSSSKCKLPVDGKTETISLFDQKNTYGFWAASTIVNGKVELRGKVEMTLEVLPESSAKLKPAGEGREDPNKNPTLPEPNRPATSFAWFSSPFKSLRYIIWRRFKWYILGFLLFLIIFLLVVLFFYSAPGYTMKKILGA